MSINKKIFTTPKTRKFARELGANISEIQEQKELEELPMKMLKIILITS